MLKCCIVKHYTFKPKYPSANYRFSYLIATVLSHTQLMFLLLRMRLFKRWPSWCYPVNDVGVIDSRQIFWRTPGLIRRDGIHPTLEGAALISRNLAGFISQPNGQFRVETGSSCILIGFSALHPELTWAIHFHRVPQEKSHLCWRVK